MGCFTACFHTCKHKKKILKPTSNKINSITPKALQITHENVEDSVSNNATKLEAKTPEVANSSKLIVESNKEEEQFSRSSRKKITFDLTRCDKEKEEEDNTLSDSSVSSYISYPPNHRYHCCRISDDEFEGIDLDDNDDLEDNVNNNVNMTIQEESSESLFTLSIDSRKVNLMPEMVDKDEVNSPLKLTRNRSQCVLNPIEIVSQWKGTKAITTSPSVLLKHQEDKKENINLINCVHEQPSLKQLNQIAVDTSLSSWLVDTPNSKNSAASVGNSPTEMIKSPIRPILGALTVAELKDLANSSLSLRSLSHSSDDKPIIIGTVGSYWRHTGQAKDSDSASSSCGGISSVNSGLHDGNNSHSTPFTARLERALDSVLAQA